MEKFIFFGILSLPVIILSWRALFNIKSHGFYRFFSWECIIWLAISNLEWWFTEPFSFHQLISWLMLIISSYLVISGALMMKKSGKAEKSRSENELFQFEKTTELVDQGIFRYIRHPLYSSLIFLTWGIFLKNADYFLFAVALLSTVFLYFTAISDEHECIQFFGESYRKYMKRSKRFIPFVV